MAIPGEPARAGPSRTDGPPTNTKTPCGEEDRRVKLQHFLVMKAFNLRKGKQTLAQQFQFLKRVDPVSGREYLELDALCSYLSIPPFRRMVLCSAFSLPTDAPRIEFDAFLRFLQTAAVQAAREEKELHAQYPPPPPQTPRSNLNDTNQDISLSMVCFQPSLLSMRFAHPPPAPGLWKKREITIQERITEYTKIDEHGKAQHLVEKEKHQTEVIHMESLQGEFAHREITHYEQLEQLNDEIVHHDQGREEFVHLKSQHDEVSRFESSIPANAGPSRPEECEQPPPSPTIKRDPSAMDTEAHTFGSGQDPREPFAEMTPEEYEQFQAAYGMGQVPQEDAEIEGLMEERYPMEPPSFEER
ncbi:hypothetical protein Poli38472_012458 [Pythium oligandrum]|uniref:Uncharacterized protein n=1 Tax=Pythium oligandrum TaxID=41045 RepID=A0A8K1CPF4_PYTOL|nr:hypothetical protein Poli38472_012458 [Pythium oligandrum]|eukprot:TMW67342.1 hypothetical protein Poli38472_012458 [Pythium oligandrum]